MKMDVDKFIDKQLELIEIEKEAAIEETRCLHENVSTKLLEHQGVCIRKVKIVEKRSGLYGRTVIKFGPQWIEKGLPAHHITSGDIVGVSEVGDYVQQKMVLSGVVISVKLNNISVAFETLLENIPLDDSTVYSLAKLANDVTHKRIKNALLDLKKSVTNGNSHLIEVLYGTCPVSEPINSKDQLNFFDKNLNQSQCDSVKFALDQKEIAVIHGPPGTGKTTTLIEVIRQLALRNLKIIVSAPSNVAVDNIAEKLASTEVKFVRLGHPARTSLEIQNVTLDAKLENSDGGRIIEDIRKELDSVSLSMKNPNHKIGKHQKRNEIKNLSRELRNREVVAIREILKNADVVLATLTSSHPGSPLKHLPENYFDIVIIDECSQALEAACLIPLLLAKKCILAGDHLQLPPTIISEKAAKEGLEVTLMERLLNNSEKYPLICRMLDTQYRMHNSIMNFSSHKLYGGKLLAHSSVENHLLKDLPNVETNEDTVVPLLLIDTAGCDFYELELEDEMSKGNEDEANLAVIHLKKLIQSGVLPNDIAIITPYNLQVEILRSLISNIYPGVEIKSVDGFQGRQKEVVILSFVRSNSRGEIGFLAEGRRLNVSITRARRHLAVICDSETVSHNPFLKEFVEYLNQVGEVRSAHQYLDDMPNDSKHTSVVSNKLDTAKRFAVPSVAKVRSSVSRDAQKSANSKTNSKATDINQSNLIKNENSKAEYRKILESFKSDKFQTTYSFPSTLNSFERRLVHEIAEKLGLLHLSQGEGEERQIVVSKVIKKQKISISVDNTCHEVKQNVESQVPKEDVVQVESHLEEKNDEMTVVHRAKPSVKKKSKTVKKQAQPNELDVKEEDEDFDAVIQEFVRNDNQCGFKKCKTSTTVLYQLCKYCNVRYCLSHSLPEIHGCGDAVRSDARKTALREFEKEKSVTFGQKRVDRHKLEQKLDKRLDELSNKRSRKPPKSNK